MRFGVRHTRLTALLATIAIAAAAVPAIVMAQSGGDNPIPEDARQLLPESRWSELYCLDAKWQIEAALESIDDIETTLNRIDPNLTAINARTNLPDFSAMRDRLRAEQGTVCDAQTAISARDAATQLTANVQAEVRDPLNELSASLVQNVQASRTAMEEQIRTSVNNYLDSERVTQESRLKQEFDAQVAQRLNALGHDPTQGDRDAAEASARAYVQQLADQLEISAKSQAQQLAEQLRTDDEQRLRAVSDELNSLASRMRNRTTTSLSATAQTYLNDYLKARRDVIMAVVDWRIQQFKTRVQARLVGLQQDRVQEVTKVLDDIAIDRDKLLQALNTAIANNNRAAFQQAAQSFQDSWQNRQADFDKTHVAAASTCEAQLDGINAALNGISRLRSALPDGTRLPQAIQDRIASVSSSLNELQSAAEDVKTACEGGDATGTDILSLVDLVRSKVAAVNNSLADLRQSAGTGSSSR